MRTLILWAATLALGVCLPHPALARVHEETESSFVVRLGVDVAATPEAAWDMLVQPKSWWDGSHTFSGDAANLSLDPRAGGCFCEVLPGTDAQEGKDAREAKAPGSVEHLRVVYVEPPRALRMVGAMGPLQPDAVTGVLTMVLQPGEAGTRILWEYAVAGHFRKQGIAAAVDAALTGQILRLGEKLGARQTPRTPGSGDGGSGAGAVLEDGQAIQKVDVEAGAEAGQAGKENPQQDSAETDRETSGETGRDEGAAPVIGR